VLSFKNVASNVHAIETAIGLNEADTVLGVLPFFHSFGYTVTLWAALSLAPAGVYHYNPLEPRQIGKLAEQYKATVLLGTPTFLRTYLRRVEPQQFKTLEVVVVGAEKLPQQLSDAFENTFGIRPVEGYGTTELSPLVSVNIPPNRGKKAPNKPDLREGSVGQPVEFVDARIVSLEDASVLPIGSSGMLQIRGPNVMQGYLKRPDLTAAVIRDGWYETGDVAFIDEDGFIHITGRQSRFSKIGGEMIPHIQIEETIAKVLGSSDEGTMSAVVTAVPDEKKGERLIVLHTKLSMKPGEIIRALAAEGLPNLFLPSEDSFFQVSEIPVLGSGKLDLRAIKQVAIDNFAKK
jgi:acyl-[acyl-carrier-protein]-phospholipid O-acyltransferase / long-chain-fatty-acid--[acyl-carrier-protein] ligase